MKKVEQGATLYISWQDAILANFEKITGMKVISNCMRANKQVSLSLPDLQAELSLQNDRRMNLTVYQDAEVLAAEEDGNPAFICHKYGKGQVYFLSFPMEAQLADQPRAFENTDYYRFYQQMFAKVADRKITTKSSPQIAVTEHPIDDAHCTIVAQNYGLEKTYTLTVQDGWSLNCVEYGKVCQASNREILVEPEQNSICRFCLEKL